MIPIFRLLTGIFEERIGWYLGLAIYWLTWGGVFPYLMLGPERLRRIIRPQKLTFQIFLLVLFPLVMASLYQLIPGMDYQKPGLLITLLLLSTPFGNGFFEELLWRGVYMELFPDNILFRIVWPSIFFALWHYAPVSVSSGGNVVAMIIGSGLFGFYLSFLANKTGTIWWSIVAHILGGLIMIV